MNITVVGTLCARTASITRRGNTGVRESLAFGASCAVQLVRWRAKYEVRRNDSSLFGQLVHRIV